MNVLVRKSVVCPSTEKSPARAKCSSQIAVADVDTFPNTTQNGGVSVEVDRWRGRLDRSLAARAEREKEKSDRTDSENLGPARATS